MNILEKALKSVKDGEKRRKGRFDNIKICKKCGYPTLGYIKVIGWGPKQGTVYHYKLKCNYCGSSRFVKRTKAVYEIVKYQDWVKTKAYKRQESVSSKLHLFWDRSEHPEYTNQEIEELGICPICRVRELYSKKKVVNDGFTKQNATGGYYFVKTGVITVFEEYWTCKKCTNLYNARDYNSMAVEFFNTGEIVTNKFAFP